jgi:periplasmic protein TonB
MKRINDLHACLLVSLIAHTGLVGSGILYFSPPPKDKPFEIDFVIEEELLPEAFEVKEEKKIELPIIKQEDVLEPVLDESIPETPEPDKEDEEIKKSLLRYQDSIKQKIQREKQYPRWALRIGHEGGARITFSVLPSGQIKDLRLLESSGFEELDKEALDAVRRASPFLSFPEGLKDDKIKVELDIIFHVSSKKR